MTDVLLERTFYGFKLADGEDPKLAANIPVGKTVVVDLPQKFSRSRAQHSFFFGILKKVWENAPDQITTLYDNREEFRGVMTSHLGYCKTHKTSKIETHTPTSITKMEHGTFNEFVNDSLDFYERLGFDKFELLEAGIDALHPVDNIDDLVIRGT
jgi:hypothetical protein